MLSTEQPQTRTLTVVLPESEWLALRDAEPDALGWLQACIRQRLSGQVPGTSARPGPVEPAESWDDY